MAARVLIVDHQRNLAEALAYLLRRAGYTVRVAANGADALAAAAAESPDVVLLETSLPDLDGYTLYERLRGEGAGHCGIVVLTANQREAERDKALALGADGYLVKPFDPADLIDRVRVLAAART